MEYNINELKQLIKENKLVKKIEAIFLYGSSVTEEKNEYSDIDIFILTQNSLSSLDERKIEKIMDVIFDSKILDLSIYDKNKFQNLLKSGSLFLHHLKNEAKLIYSLKNKSKKYFFNNLCEFKGLSEDILLYSRMLKKTEESIIKNGINYFDLCVLGMIARNTLTLLNYKENKETCKFGKYEVFKIINNKNLRLKIQEYFKLLEYRSYFRRSTPKIKLPSLQYLKIIISNIEELIQFTAEKIGVCDTIDRFYFLSNDKNMKNIYTSLELFTDLERDLYFYLKKYSQDTYNLEIYSIRIDFVEYLSEKYKKDKEDEFFEVTLRVLNHINGIRKNSNNYSIDFSNVTEINKRQKNLENKLDSTFVKDLYRYRKIRDKFFKNPSL